MKIREINRQDIEEVRNLNRSEIVEQIYYYKNGALVLKDECNIIKNWITEELNGLLRTFMIFMIEEEFFMEHSSIPPSCSLR